MKITKEWLQGKSACQDGLDWVTENKLIGLGGIKFTEALIKADKLDWANWLIVRIMTYKQQYVSYAVYAAEQVIDLYEKKYPNDKRPRQAIEAAKKCIKDNTDTNAAHAAYAAADAAHAAHAAYAAADAAHAAYAAADAAHAAYAAYAAADAAHAADAAYAAYAADAAAGKTMKLKILNYGLKLLTENEKIDEE